MPTSPSLHDLLNEALRCWIAVTGVDPDATATRTLGEFSVWSSNKQLRQAQDADPTGLAAYLHLNFLARERAAKHSVSALRLVEEPDVVEREICSLRALLESLAHPILVEATREFQQQLRCLAEQHGVLEQTRELLDDVLAVGDVRLAALSAMRDLRRDVFARGPRRAERLRYNRRVLKFWNVNSLVRALEAQPESGVSVCLVRDPQVAAHSFFALAVRDGDNCYLWSDAEETSHPLQKTMSRRAEQRLEDRAQRFRFPYQLLDARFSDESEENDAEDDTFDPEAGLVRTNVEAVPIASIEDLPPDQILWALMMFDLVARADLSEGELSCTGETVYLALAGSSQKAIGEVVPLRRSDVSSAAIDEQLARHPHGERSTRNNEWMETRYGAAVDEDVLNPPPATTDIAVVDRRSFLARLDPVSFGTATRMRDDRLWLARYNFAKRVKKLALAEFERRQDEVLDWYETSVRANLDWFLDAACRGGFEMQVPLPKDTWATTLSEQTTNFVDWQRFSRGSEPIPVYREHAASLFHPSSRRRSTTPPRCIVSGETASVWTLFEPQTAGMLRMMAAADLPDVLQHWASKSATPYTGNPILDRTDPLDTNVENPWQSLRFGVLLGLSLREFRRQCKRRGVAHPEDFSRLREEGWWSSWRAPVVASSSDGVEESEDDA